MEHVPVLLTAVLKMAHEPGRPARRILDGTFGRGGHTRALLQAEPGARVLALDCDEDAIRYGRENFADEIASGRLQLVHANFSDIASLAERFPAEFRDRGFDVILLDLGVSSPQLDQAERGFSFYHSGPLDMRMDRTQEISARDIVNFWNEDDLIRVFQEYGEIRRPHRVVAAILERRDQEAFATTADLSRLIEKVEGWTRKGHHPATRYFLALRLEVNKELERVRDVLPALVDQLAPGGRLLIITFHSLEDRIIKVGFKALADRGRILTKKVIQADWPERKSNPRARSAKLRVFEKGDRHESATRQ